jgi:hypothetical protein
MINRTIVNGLSAQRIDDIRTPLSAVLQHDTGQIIST